jgi:hypothetical protein
MAHHDWDPRDDRAFHPSSVPTAQLIGLHLADRGVHEKSRQLWFIVDKRHVYFRLDDIYSMWAPGNLRLAGLITTWEGHPEYDSHHFHLGWHNATRRKNGGLRQTATLTVHNVTPPCGVCGSRTNRHGWTFECPTKACNFSIPDSFTNCLI